MIAAGADVNVNAADKEGKTPFYVAEVFNAPKMVEILKEADSY